MELRVDEREWIQFQWPYLMAFLGGERRVSDLAYATGAFARRREIESPAEMLQLLLTWAVAERSLQETAALAAEAGLADVSDVALMKRFVRAGDWLGALLAEVLGTPDRTPATFLRLRLIDASAIHRRGSRGIDARLHLSLDLQTHRVDAFDLTSVREGESLQRFEFRPGEIAVADRGYAHRAGLAKVVRAGAFFIVRLPWSNVPLETRTGEPMALLSTLRTLPEAAADEIAVQFRTPEGEAVPCRLVAIRKSEIAAHRARQQALKDQRKHATDARTLEAAGYFFVLTNLPPEVSALSVLQLYRFRWQIEMKFKTLKSMFHLGKLPVRSAELLRVYVLAKLLVAFLIDDLVAAAESFSPWGYPLAADQLVAADAHPS
jgi:hypothetical protein